MNRFYSIALISLLGLAGCKTSTHQNHGQKTDKTLVDLVVKNALIYTVNHEMDRASAMVINEGKIVAVGGTEDILLHYEGAETLDVQGKPIFPGFVDAHCHFLGYARTLLNVDLVGTLSKRDVLAKTSSFFGEDYQGWIQGRGWDHTDWEVKEFPSKEDLDLLFPNNPVALRRVDGHALWVNSKALDLANINAETQVAGGDVMLNKQGEPSGILLDNAADLVLNLIPENIKEQDQEVVQRAQQNCLAVGLTMMHDAGLPLEDVLFLKEQFAQKKLRFRLYQMISHDEEAVSYFEENGAIQMDRFTVKSIKCYMDGALGSRGALLKENYHDAAQRTGLQLTSDSAMNNLVQRAIKMGFQVNTHAIGDMAVHKALNFYGSVLDAKNDQRWRIEHSQVVDPVDLDLYGEYNIIPSVQPTHCTSDMYWAPDRLGSGRSRTAYAYKDLLKVNGWLCTGSDFPVEHINPLYGFYAAVARMDQKQFPEGGFQTENALTREEALKAMTVWAARAAFMEDDLGSLEVGKKADFVVLDKDIMQIPIEETYRVKVLRTVINGETLFVSQ